MKNIGLSGFLCGGDSVNCMPQAQQTRHSGAPRPNASGRRDTSLAQRRGSGPLGALGQRDLPQGFKAGLDDWTARETGPEQKRTEAAERMKQAQTAGRRDLTLARLGLTRLTSQIGVMKGLERLDLSHNKLAKLPASIGDLAKLTHLVVDANALECLPDELEHLSLLEELSANTNKLSQVPESIHKLTHLKTVDLKSNQIWTLPPQWAELFGRLRILDLSDNRLKQLPSLPEREAAGARADVRRGTLDLDVSNNNLAMLPTNYGAFRYHGLLDNHTLVNAAGTIVVRTEHTRIREALVSVGRLGAGRGVSREAARAFARESRLAARTKAPPETDNESQGSFGDYVLRHGEPGQAARFERPQPEPAPESVHLGKQPEWTKPRATQELDELAGLFAGLDAQPPFAAGVQPIAQAGLPVSGNGYAAALAPNAGMDPMSVLAGELQRLPEQERAAILGMLASVDPATLEAALARMQATWVGGGAGMAAPQPQPFPMQPVQPFAAPLGAYHAQQTVPPIPSAVQPPLAAGTSGAGAWADAELPQSNQTLPPWAGASTSRSDTPREDGKRWAAPRWTTLAAQDSTEEREQISGNSGISGFGAQPTFDTYGLGEQPTFGEYGWAASPPKEEIPMRPVYDHVPEEPEDFLTMFENLMRSIG